MADDWLAIAGYIAIGLGFGGLIGAVLSPLVLQRLRDRSQLRTRLRAFLDPVYNYADELKSHEPEVGLGPDPWGSITPSIRERLKTKERSAIDSLAIAAVEFEKAQWRYNRHVDRLMVSDLRVRFDDAFKPKYMNEGNKVTGDRVGQAANWELNDDQLFRRIYPHLVRHLDQRKEGWDEVTQSSSSHGSYVDIIVDAIARADQKVLDRVYEVCTTHILLKESRDVLRDLDTAHAVLLRQTEATCRVLKP